MCVHNLITMIIYIASASDDGGQSLLPLWVALAGGTLVSSVLGFFKFLLPWLDRYIDKRNKRSYAHRIECRERIFDKLADIRHNTTAGRVCIFKGHNCGGIPHPTSRYFVSSAYSSDDKEHEDNLINLRDYQEIPADMVYVQMIHELISGEVVLYKTSDMESCILKDFYKAEGVVESMIIGLSLIGQEYFYISIASYEGSFTESEKTHFRITASTISSLLKEHTE